MNEEQLEGSEPKNEDQPLTVAGFTFPACDEDTFEMIFDCGPRRLTWSEQRGTLTNRLCFIDNSTVVALKLEPGMDCTAAFRWLLGDGPMPTSGVTSRGESLPSEEA